MLERPELSVGIVSYIGLIEELLIVSNLDFVLSLSRTANYVSGCCTITLAKHAGGTDCISPDPPNSICLE